MHEDRKLYLVFEFLDVDLKKHMDTHPQMYREASVVKVGGPPLCFPSLPLSSLWPAADLLPALLTAPPASPHAPSCCSGSCTKCCKE